MSRIGAAVGRVNGDSWLVGCVAVTAWGLIMILVHEDGGFAVTVWMPAALFLALVLALAVWFVDVKLTILERTALIALGALTLWTASSVIWAGVGGDALIGADRMLLYFCAFALFLVLPWRQGAVTFFVSLFSIGIAAVTAWEFLMAADAPGNPSSLFISGRLASPISYSNADCALLLMAGLPAVVLAARRELPIALRGLLFATAGITIELAIACQSRTSLLAFPLLFVVLSAAIRWRLRLLIFTVPVAAAVALSLSRILDLYDATLNGAGGAVLREARIAVIASAGALLVVGWLVAAIDSRYQPSPTVRKAASWAVAVIATFAVLGTALEGYRAVPHPLRSLNDQWVGFVHGGGYSPESTSHFISTGTNRYDIWRVGVHELTSSPFLGAGADNFATDYLRRRRTNSENPLYPHSFFLSVAGQTGLVGVGLFGVFMSAALLCAWRAVRRHGFTAALAAGAALPFGYFLVHGAVDWLWEVPALGAGAFACLAIAVRLGRCEQSPNRSVAPPRLALVGLGLVMALVLGLPWLAARETSLAAKGWVSDRGLAYRRLALAANLNPLSDVPAETEGLIAARSGQFARARVAFSRAVSRNPRNWYSHLELAVVNSETGRGLTARRELDLARALNPRELVLSVMARRLRNGRQITQTSVDVLLNAQDRAIQGAR